MDKKFRILASLLTPILATPVIAAACNSKKEQDKNNEKNQKNELMTPQDQGNLNQQDKNEKTDNNQNSESSVNPNETDDEKEKKKIEEEKKKIEEEKKLKEKQEQEDKKNSEVIKGIVKVQEDAFATFHSLQDFLDQINVYAKEEKINNLELAENDKTRMLLEDTNGGKNKIKLKLGSYTFEVSLGKVYKDKVVTKYAINDSNSTIKISSDNKFDDINNTDDKIFVKQIGYSIDSSKNRITISTMPKNTVEVPKHLPLKIKSLKNAFLYLNSDKVLNLDNWNVSNVINMSTMFFSATKFNQDISKWNTKNVTNMIALFSGAENFDKPLNSWNVSKVTDMYQMFFGAHKFNQDLNEWNVSNVTNMEEMFLDATNFNGKIENWNVENVTELFRMFVGATKFSQDLSGWRIKNAAIKKISDNVFNHNYEYKNKVLDAWRKNN
ncbi:BspA family leucine-rich repeat surface protein [Mycoplasmopsis bovis]|uniref:BspA family leucine-rich repeat surface protein n=1 Tax=Mycoplasmopsis bovis TaxID=28903 RepID=UPI003BF6F269